jgi:hypothetical protein
MYLEFAGQQGQVDPMGMSPAPPQMGRQSPPPGMVQPGMGAAGDPANFQQMGQMGQMPQGGQTGGPMGDPSDMGGMNDPGMNSAPGEESGENDLPTQYQRVIDLLGNKTPNQIMAIQRQLNTKIQELLMSKSKNAGRRGMHSMFQHARDTKAGFGKP